MSSLPAKLKYLTGYRLLCSKVAGNSVLEKDLQRPIYHYVPPARQAWLTGFLSGHRLGIVDLDQSVFGASPRVDILHRVVVWQRAKMRAGNAKTKDRGEVRGGGRKPHRQKGTGKARLGSIRAPQCRGGGVVHGPRGPVSYDYTLPKKVRRIGLRTALSVKYAQGDLTIVDSFDMDQIKTKDFVSLMNLHKWSSVLLVDGGDVNKNLSYSTRNLQKVDVLPSRGLNVYSILLHNSLVLSLGALRLLEERLSEDLQPVKMLSSYNI